MADPVLPSREAIDRHAAALADMLESAELTLRVRLARRIERGLTLHPDDLARLDWLTASRSDARGLVEELLRDTPGVVDEILRAAARAGVAQAVRELAGRVTIGELPSLYAATSLRLELLTAVQDSARALLRWPDDVYRRAIADPVSDLLLGAEATTRTAQARAWQRLISRGVTGFVDSAGRRWEASSYVEMATRTATRRAWDGQHQAVLTSVGIELVQVVVGNDACQACASRAGQVLRIDAGPTGWIEAERIGGEGTVRVFVDGTLDTAREHGWQHPNCRCVTVAYMPGLPGVTDATTYDPVLEQQREHLRYLERQVRAWKIRTASSVDASTRAAAQARVREYQRRIREHVADTGLIRKPYREQINLGNG